MSVENDGYDDGLGPYVYCERGLSRCDHQTCECVDNIFYRAAYWSARRRRGWKGEIPDPSVTLRGMMLWATCGALLGLSLVALAWWWLR